MISWHFVNGLICIAFLIALIWNAVVMIREDAARDQIDAIVKQNQEAGDAGENARRSRADCAADGGKLWDFERGVCVSVN